MNREKSMSLALLGVIIPVLVLAGCATTRGKVSNGSYYAPLGNFVLPLDRGNIRIQDRNDDRSGMVSILDDMGNNQGITYVGLTASADDLRGDLARRDSAYRGFVHDYALPALFPAGIRPVQGPA
jgi:hypothetical protein